MAQFLVVVHAAGKFVLDLLYKLAEWGLNQVPEADNYFTMWEGLNSHT
jgi:hypothetical protein